MMAAFEPTIRRLAFVHGASGTFPRAVVDGAEAWARRHGLQTVFKAPYPATPVGFPSLIGEIAASRADLILGVGTTEADLEFARQLRAHPTGARLVGLVATPIEAFKETLGTDAHGFVGPSQ